MAVIDGNRAVSIAITVALHAIAFAALWQLEFARKAFHEVVPLMVDLIAPPEPEPKRLPPEVVPPKPLPVARLPVPRPVEQPLIAADTSTQSPLAVAPQPKPELVVNVPAPPAPARVVPPSFDAAYLRNPPPAYPAVSRRRGEQGTVMLRVYVGADGGAQKVLVHASSGHERLDQAALDAVHQWRFVPARQGEQPVSAWVQVPIRFALEN